MKTALRPLRGETTAASEVLRAVTGIANALQVDAIHDPVTTVIAIGAKHGPNDYCLSALPHQAR
jgi:hypothetical protein